MTEFLQRVSGTVWKVYVQTRDGEDVYYCSSAPISNHYYATIEFVPANGLDAGSKHVLPLSRVSRIVELAA